MKKWWLTPAVTLVLAFGGYVLRAWQLGTAFEETGLVTPGMPATWALIALVIVAGVALGLLVWPVKKPAQRGYLGSYALTAGWPVVFYVLAGGMLAAAGVWGLVTAPSDFRIFWVVLSVCLIPTGACVAWTGFLARGAQEGAGRFNWPLIIPGYCACVWLVCAYQGHTANPAVMEYAFLFLGIVAAILATYGIASSSFEEPRPRYTLWLSGMGVVLLATALADKRFAPPAAQFQRGWAPEGLMCFAFALYLFTQMTVLLYRAAHPAELEPWAAPEPEPEETSTGDDENA